MKKLAIVILAITIIFPSAYLLADDEAEAKGAKAKQESTTQTQTQPDQTAMPVSPPAVKPDSKPSPTAPPAPPPPSPPSPTSPAPTLEQLQAQRALLSERIAGAEEAKALLDQLIVAGKVKLQRYDEAIQAAQQSQAPPTKPTKK